MDYVDIPVRRFKVSEIFVSDISSHKLGILGKVKSEPWCHSDHAVTMSSRLVVCVIGRMNDQQATVSPELFVQRAHHGSVERCDSVRLVPGICCDQHQTCAVCVGEGWME